MARPKYAPIDMEIYGYVKEGKEMCHPVAMFSEIKYDIELEAEDEDADLDLYIADSEGNVIYQDEDEDSGASAWFIPGSDAVYLLYVKSVSADTEYTISISESEDDEE